MDLLQLISNVKSGQALQADCSLLILHGKSYPLYIFSWLIRSLKSDLGKNVQSISLQEHDYNDVMARVQMQFLTGSVWYWLRYVDQLDKKKQKKLVQYLAKHTGPNTIVLYLDSLVCSSFFSECSSSLVVTVPDVVTRADFIKLCTIFKIDVRVKDAAASALFSRKIRITFDSLFFLVQCLSVVPASSISAFLSSNIDESLVPSNSLFSLSTAFFKKSPASFYPLWISMKDNFPDQFWISYFSDQVWRAYYVIACNQSGNKKESSINQISRRLPFSFIEKDWRMHTLEDMQKAHNALYTIDYQLKNGLNIEPFESFFLSFFS